MLPRYAERLLETAADVEYPYGKSYTYGCFQALLSERFFPGWQHSMSTESSFIDRELGKRLAITPEQRIQIEQKIRTDKRE